MVSIPLVSSHAMPSLRARIGLRDGAFCSDDIRSVCPDSTMAAGSTNATAVPATAKECQS